jgi:transcription-repair coupling factor (superfamily II helicase)
MPNPEDIMKPERGDLFTFPLSFGVLHLRSACQEAFLLLKNLLDLWAENISFSFLASNLNKKSGYRTALTGFDGSARAFFMAALARLSGRPAVVITSDPARAEKVYSEINAFLPGEVRILPSRELFVNPDIISRSEEYQQQRLRFISWLHRNEGGVYVAPVAAFLSRALPPDLWKSQIIELYPGLRLDRQDLISGLVERAYERVNLVENRGQFSARGDIIDIYPPSLEEPVRLGLFDDIVESVRHFDPLSQRTTVKLRRAEIAPACELVLPAEIYAPGEKEITGRLNRALSRMRRRGENETAARLKQQVGRHLERLAEPGGLDLLSGYFPFFYGDGSTLLDYLNSETLIVVEEPSMVAEKSRDLQREIEEYYTGSVTEGELLGTKQGLLWTGEEIFSRSSNPLVSCALFTGSAGLFSVEETAHFETKAAPAYHGQWDLFKNDYIKWAEEDYRIFLLAETEQRGKGLKAMIAGQLGEPAADDRDAFQESMDTAGIISGALEEGFIIPELKLAVVTEQNLLPRRKKKRKLSRREGIRLSDYRELAIGDYVVHEQHGVGKYQGISTLDPGGIKRDYLLLKYRGTDKLYIPVEQVGMIQKYSGGEGPAPRLHSLGGGEWQRIKNRVNHSVEELARELLSLYAARQAVKGYSFGPDSPWQQEFEANFPFEETPDQERAIADVKADMEKSHPMDRLICGDVGYGKTEVAMRAAFKAVMEGKQAVILVPTTVLSQQHFRTFSERFEGFPVKVAQLSRFVPAARQKEIVKEIAAGKIDIVIGTHRILSKDVRFHDLGLLVVDEEQRFGVRQKEKMKRLRLEVDTLAMTATPIPRTLHLSLAGARDLSIIDTPPEDRYPVQTYVMEYSEELVREAVQRELNRQGQVFIVFNRVERINAFAAGIEKLFPDAGIAVGHGQMPEAALEKVMIDFQDGRYQILVSSTIIESGLDIPNVNTLIVCDADRFGLAQLYQIRGRVGRSNRLAYAYLTYRKDKIVSETAQKRLRAIKEFTELGSGFKIALRDLEIRGAGNILGAEQHGFITAVGFDLYVKLLDQAVAELKNEKDEAGVSTRLEVQVSAYLPSSYITAQDQKVDIYQRIYNSSSGEELDEIREELIDRYGSPPAPVEALLQVAQLRISASRLGIELIQQQKGLITLHFHVNSAFVPGSLKKTASMSEGTVTVSRERPYRIKLKTAGRPASPLTELSGIISELAKSEAAFG